jgi:DNA-binding SARP family transcriptional activator
MTLTKRLSVRLLGSLEVRFGDAPIEFPSRKAATLFAYLAHNRQISHSRGKLADLLWPDADESSARRNLSTTLWRVRLALRDVSKVRLQTKGEVVSLECLDDGLDVDAESFRALIAPGEVTDEQRLHSLIHAEELYKGDFLRDLDCLWCEEDRRYYSALYHDLLSSIVEAQFKRGEYASSIAHLQRLLDVDPLSEEANTKLMLAYHLTGKRATALAQFDRFKAQLSADLGVEPSQPIVELWRNLKRQSDSSAPPAELKRSALPTDPPWLEIQMVGRESEVSSIVPILADMTARLSICVITGVAGVGKSRLAAALGEEAELRGYEILRGRCPDLETSLPYQVLVQALWPRIQRHISIRSPLAEVIRRLVAAVSPQVLPTAPQDGGRLSDSALVSELLLGLLTEPPAGRGTLVILEDLHRIDRASEALLANLVDRTQNGRLILVATVRDDEPSATEVVRRLSPPAMVVPLQPLERTSTDRLAAVLLGVSVIPHQLSEILWTTTAGVPLFVLELLKYLSDRGFLHTDANQGTRIDSTAIASLGPTLPKRVVEVLRSRVEGLGSSAREILMCSAVIGTEVPYGELEGMLGLPLDQLSEGIELLLERRLLAEGEGGLRFSHDIVRGAVLSAVPKDKRRELHMRAAEILERRGGQAQALVWHFEEAGDYIRASQYSEVAGDAARGLHANADALRWYTASLARWGGRGRKGAVVERRRARLLLKRQAVLDLMGDRRGQAQDVREALRLAVRWGGPTLKAEAYYHHSRLLCRENRNDEALSAADRAIRLYRRLRDTHGEATAAESLGLVYMNVRDPRGASSAFKQARSLFQRAGDIGGEARALVHLGTLLVLDGKGTQSLRYLDRAERMLSLLGDEHSLAGAVLQKGVLHRDMGQLRVSEALLSAGISLMQEIGDRIGEARGLSQLSFTHVAMGHLREAMHEARRALRMACLANDTRARIVFLNNAAYGAFRCVGDFRRAELYIGQTVRLARESSRQENLANYYDSMAAVLLDKDEPREALRWARQSRMAFRAWRGHFKFLSPQINFRVGVCHYELGEYGRAVAHLERAAAAWKSEGDKGLRILALSFVAAAHCHEGRRAQATRSARETERLLQSVDGVEQLQCVHWNQFNTFRRLGFGAAAKRSLRRAYVALLQQSTDLRGRHRRQFLYGVKKNREILAEVGRVFEASIDLFDATRRKTISVHPLAVLGAFDNAHERRKVVAEYVAAGVLTQQEMALRLGVSERTIRSDVAFLKTAPRSTSTYLSHEVSNSGSRVKTRAHAGWKRGAPKSEAT